MVRSISSNALFHKKKSQISTNYCESLEPLVKESTEEKRRRKGYTTEFLCLCKVNTINLSSTWSLWEDSLQKQNICIMLNVLKSSCIKILQVCNEIQRMTEATAWGKPVNRAHFVRRNNNEERSVTAILITNSRTFTTET